MGSKDNDRERMRDIVERLELQAFVADKIQSGMKPLIMDCLEEITHLRCQYEALHNQAEMNARLLTENASLRAENEKLRENNDYLRSEKERLGKDVSNLIVKKDEARAENEKLRNEVMSDYHEGWEEGVKAERERCARVAEQARDDTCDGPVAWSMADSIAAAIRESGDE